MIMGFAVMEPEPAKTHVQAALVPWAELGPVLYYCGRDNILGDVISREMLYATVDTIPGGRARILGDRRTFQDPGTVFHHICNLCLVNALREDTFEDDPVAATRRWLERSNSGRRNVHAEAVLRALADLMNLHGDECVNLVNRWHAMLVLERGGEVQ